MKHSYVMNGADFLIHDCLLNYDTVTYSCYKHFQIEKFLRELAFSSISPLNILAFYM